MHKHQIFRNSLMSVGQFLLGGIVLFFLYKFLLNQLGAELFGIWSLVLSLSSFANIANMGFSASVVKFVAKYLAMEEGENAISIIDTSLITIGVLVGLVLLVFYPVTKWILAFIVPDSHINNATKILPYALMSLWISVIAGVFQAALEGLQRIDLSSFMGVIRVVIHLLFCLMLVPQYGLMGLAYAHVMQAIILTILGWGILKSQIPALPVIPYRWGRRHFREMVGYGLNIQMITVSQMLYDPITKGLLAKFGGLDLTGYFEMANRMVMQLRGLLVSAVRVIVPTIADLKEKNPDSIEKIYKDTYRFVLFVALPYYSAIIALTPSISSIWIGHFEDSFMTFSIILSFGWFINTLIAPAYYVDLGIGDLTWNTRGHLIMAVSNVGLGLLLGYISGGKGVVVGWVLSLIAGSVTILLSFHRRKMMPYAEIFPKEYFLIGLVSLAGISISLFTYRMLSHDFGLASITLIIFLTMILLSAWPIWKHPMRKRLVDLSMMYRAG